MSINNISSLLERFMKMKPTDTYVKEVFIDVVKDVMNIEITTHEIKVQNNTIFLTVHPALKTEIYLHKKTLLSKLEKKLPKHPIKNIV